MSATATASTRPPSASCDPSNNTGDTAPSVRVSSRLFLFTFVATIVLLLGTSSIIISRSFILRRQRQHRLQDALAASVIYDSQGRRRKKRQKPKFFDVCITSSRGPTWGEMMPLSVQQMVPKKNLQLLDSRSHRRYGWFSYLNILGYNSLKDPPPALDARSSIATKHVLCKEESLQVLVLIAMPSPIRSHNPSTPWDEKGKAPVHWTIGVAQPLYPNLPAATFKQLH